MKKEKLLKKLKDILVDDFGKPCKDFNWFCGNCAVWMAYDILVDILLDDKKRG